MRRQPSPLGASIQHTPTPNHLPPPQTAKLPPLQGCHRCPLQPLHTEAHLRCVVTRIAAPVGPQPPGLVCCMQIHPFPTPNALRWVNTANWPLALPWCSALGRLTLAHHQCHTHLNSGSFWGNLVYCDVIGDPAPGHRRRLPPNTRAQAAVRATRGKPPRQYVPRHPRAQKLPGGRVFARTSFTPMQWTAPNAQSVVRTRWGPPAERSKWCSAWSANLSTSLFLSEEDHARARLNNIPSSTVYWESNQRSCTSVGCLRQNQQTRKHTAPCCRFSPKLVKKMSYVLKKFPTQEP